MSVREYHRPRSAAEALELLDGDERAALIGGGAFLRLGARGREVAVDLCDAGLDGLAVRDGMLAIGATVTYRRLETDPVVRELADGLLARSVENVVGVQLRNVVTAGGTLAGRYAFANLTTALLALDAAVVLQRWGRKPLEEFLTEKTAARDVLVEILVPAGGCRGAWQDLRRARADFAVLNVAAVRRGDDVRIAVGSRPAIARLAPGAMAAAARGDAAAAGEAAAEELDFGSDVRGSDAHRRRLCRTLVARAVEEVLA